MRLDRAFSGDISQLHKAFKILGEVSGRGPDTVLAHVTPEEAKGQPINPMTGLPEFRGEGGGQGGPGQGGPDRGGRGATPAVPDVAAPMDEIDDESREALRRILREADGGGR